MCHVLLISTNKCIDLDYFKYVNDMYGYAYGNYLLKYVATGLSRELLPGELISAWLYSVFSSLSSLKS